MLGSVVHARCVATSRFALCQGPIYPVRAGSRFALDSNPAWWKWCSEHITASSQQALATSIAIGVAVFLLGSSPALAENELAAMTNGEFKPNLVSSECFATSCKEPTKNCIDDADCKKGLMCTARCLGDSGCITGCFARFGNDVLDNLLRCSIEDHKCIHIGIISPGAQRLEDSPAPPKPLTSAFEPSSIEGEWFKVLGWNRLYDCFDCQKNTFHVKDNAASVDVDFAMATKRSGRKETSNHQHISETLFFDPETYQTGREWRQSHRTAHTQGRLFGITFWENWYVIGENIPSEPPFKVIYYTGKTVQNTYDGLFVFSRTPSLAPESLAPIYKILREAGFDPSKLCRVRNGCFDVSKQSGESARVQATKKLRPPGNLALEQGKAGSSRFSCFIEALTLRLRAWWFDALDYVEDPREAARWMFDQQQHMVWPFSDDKCPDAVELVCPEP